MPHSAAHLAIPMQLPYLPPEKREAAISALAQLLEASGQNIELNGKQYGVHAFATSQTAKEALAKSDDAWAQYEVHDFQEGGIVGGVPFAWVTVSSVEDPTPARVLDRETFQYPEFVSILHARLHDPANAHLVTALENAYQDMPRSAPALDDMLLDLCLHETYDNIASSLRYLPNKESVGLSERGRYVGKAFGVDPVAAIRSGNALADLYNAMTEANIDYIANTEDDLSKSEITDQWRSHGDDLEPVLQILGKTESDVTEKWDEWIQSIIHYKGCVALQPEGKVAIGALPFVGSAPVYITFDGVTSSSYNAVVDENYCAMLDLLRVDVRAWIDHLLVRADLPKANWEFDIVALIEKQRGLAQDGGTGESEAPTELNARAKENLRHDVLCALFPAAVPSEIDLWLNSSRSERHEIKGRFGATHEYVADIALEVLKSKAIELDQKWLVDHGVDLDKLSAMTNSTEQHLAFPQIAQAPDYEMALSNLGSSIGSSNSILYDWKTAPHTTPSERSLIDFSRLCEVLENSNYSGNMVIAFDCDLDDLEKIGVGMMEGETPKPKQVQICGAYFHIHDYTNGAGDGVELAGPWSFTTDDLKDKHLRLDNDSGDRYGIESVFGQFLASGCGISITDVPKEPLQPVTKRVLDILVGNSNNVKKNSESAAALANPQTMPKRVYEALAHLAEFKESDVAQGRDAVAGFDEDWDEIKRLMDAAPWTMHPDYGTISTTDPRLAADERAVDSTGP